MINISWQKSNISLRYSRRNQYWEYVFNNNGETLVSQFESDVGESIAELVLFEIDNIRNNMRKSNEYFKINVDINASYKKTSFDIPTLPETNDEKNEQNTDSDSDDEDEQDCDEMDDLIALLNIYISLEPSVTKK